MLILCFALFSSSGLVAAATYLCFPPACFPPHTRSSGGVKFHHPTLLQSLRVGSPALTEANFPQFLGMFLNYWRQLFHVETSVRAGRASLKPDSLLAKQQIYLQSALNSGETRLQSRMTLLRHRHRTLSNQPRLKFSV